MSALRHYLTHASLPYAPRARRGADGQPYADAQAVAISLESARWLERFGAVDGRDDRRTILKLEPARLAGNALLRPDPLLVRLASDLVAWLVLFAERGAVVDGRPRDPSTFAAIADRGSPTLPLLVERGDPFVDSLLDLLARFGERADPAWTRRLAASVLAFVEGRTHAEHFRARRMTPSLDEYLGFRTRSSIAMPLLELVDLGAGACLDDELAHADRTRELKRLAGLVLGTIHDVFASIREAREPASQNLVVVIARDRGLVNRLALHEAIEMHNLLYQCFCDHRAAHFGRLDRGSAPIDRFVIAIDALLEAHYEWCSHAARFGEVSLSGWEFVLRCCDSAGSPARLVSEG